MNGRRHPARLLALAIAAIAALGLSACGSDGGGDNPRTVTVVGSGKVTGTPDTLRADIGVEASGADVSSALNESSAQVAKVTDAVVAAGVERKDVQTQQVNLSPQYSNPAPGSSSQISGYQATNTIRVTIRDIAKASDVLAAAATAGGDNTRISNVSFAIDDDSELMKQAREAAFDDARSRAEQYASLAGDSLGKVQTITEQTSGQDQPAPLQRDSMAAAAPVPVEPGEQTLTFSVTVTYALS
ncbi:SIMPL domain-containing protein [Gordonia insulae]|uniref:26 kDa periplasmic immunogenic protein n=1 Tax=Gordonia insulae TaxID=2420509 RepID=A0A3G8JV43_9ACTN|nr:SIMPL domain-containing protein [Gordonia insulae]AZG48412.1 26 kDa periplasmic immunogenic protein [Gordonia insulae]